MLRNVNESLLLDRLLSWTSWTNAISLHYTTELKLTFEETWLSNQYWQLLAIYAMYYACDSNCLIIIKNEWSSLVLLEPINVREIWLFKGTSSHLLEIQGGKLGTIWMPHASCNLFILLLFMMRRSEDNGRHRSCKLEETRQRTVFVFLQIKEGLMDISFTYKTYKGW